MIFCSLVVVTGFIKFGISKGFWLVILNFFYFVSFNSFAIWHFSGYFNDLVLCFPCVLL